MLRSRMARIAVAVAAVAVPAGTAVALTSQPATAAFIGIKCTGLTGSAASGGTTTITGCKATSGYLGTQPFSSQPTATSSIQGGGTITWADGQTTTVGPASTTGETDTTKDASKGSCPSGTTEAESTSAVTGGFTGGGPLPGKVKVEVCVDSALNLSIEPGSKVKIN